jgi:HSP20 family protein
MADVILTFSENLVSQIWLRVVKNWQNKKMALSIFGGRGNSLLDPLPFGAIWDPFEAFSSLEHGPSRQFAKDVHAVANTQIDWRETPEAHIFKADLPGLKKEEVKVQVVDGRTLEISGERKKEEVQKGDTWHRVERAQGTFLRRFRLPENTKAEEVKAQVQDGVLTVTIPKVQKPKPQVRQIDIA